jgi:hypothetical protein
MTEEQFNRLAYGDWSERVDGDRERASALGSKVAEVHAANFLDLLRRSNEIVDSWPEWKRNILVQSGQPTVRNPRDPIPMDDGY